MVTSASNVAVTPAAPSSSPVFSTVVATSSARPQVPQLQSVSRSTFEPVAAHGTSMGYISTQCVPRADRTKFERFATGGRESSSTFRGWAGACLRTNARFSVRKSAPPGEYATKSGDSDVLYSHVSWWRSSCQ